jgi:hypothetical protein
VQCTDDHHGDKENWKDECIQVVSPVREGWIVSEGRPALAGECCIVEVGCELVFE